MKRLLVISNYSGHKSFEFKGKITRISSSIIHIQMENGKFIAFNKDSISSDDPVQAEGDEVEVFVNKQAPVSS